MGGGSAMIASGTIIGGRYRVAKPLGGGGMKMVYLAEDLRLAARPCALAEMVDTFTNPDMQQQAVAGFQREADMLAELSNEHIPRIYDRFNDQNRHYLVMEYVEGFTLEESLKQSGGKLEQGRVIDIALQIAETLEYLHGLNPPVIYRDLKPSNVMLTPGGQIKLIDFGIARHFQPFSNATMIGTQGYAPPEQYRGKVETRSDLYALGATMHHALSGRDPALEPPFSFPLLRKLSPGLNAALADLVDSALSYDVERRPPDAGEYKRRLLAIKIETLTGGLVGSREAAAAIAAAGRPQLKLPLGGGAPRAGQPPAPPRSDPSAPTTVVAPSEIVCPACRRRIPSDSRFCSYCAEDLRRVLGPASVVGPEDETRLLGAGASSPADHRHEVRYRGERRFIRRPRRFGMAALMVLFVAGFLMVRVLSRLLGLNATEPAPAIPPEAGVAPPGPFPAPAPGEMGPDLGANRSARAAALRRTLDLQGYRDVRFRLTDSSVELWGTVPSEVDRMMVEGIAFTVGGVWSLSDHLTVREPLAMP